MLQRFATQHGLTLGQAIEQFPEKAGIARLGNPEEIAGLMAYLVSPQARWLTGASIRMDGGEVKGV
jgi:3-oxoacyl-[acyl-carrier protein] reductase